MWKDLRDSDKVVNLYEIKQLPCACMQKVKLKMRKKKKKKTHTYVQPKKVLPSFERMGRFVLSRGPLVRESVSNARLFDAA